MLLVSSIDVSLKYAVGPFGRCTTVIASYVAIRTEGSYGSVGYAWALTRLFGILVHNQEIAITSFRGPARNPTDLKALHFRPPVKFRPGKYSYEFIAKLVRYASCLRGGSDEDFWWTGRVIRCKIVGERV